MMKKSEKESAVQKVQEFKELAIPEFHPETQEQRKSIQNILILALSTFPFDKANKRTGMSDTTYTYSIPGTNRKETLQGAYQLEPVPKYLEKTLHGRSQHLDEIIVLCSNLSLKKPANGVVINNSMIARCSPLDYFVHILNTSEFFREHAPYYHVVRTENDENQSVLAEAMTDILEEVHKSEKARIYVDIHGGLRDSQQIINGLLSLLKIEKRNIVPENVYSVVVPGNGIDGRIVYAGETLKLYDFISGINELMYYGRTNSLNDYEKSSAPTNKESDLIRELRTIAESIQLNNINGFEKSLDRLPDKIESCRNEVNKNSFLNLYLDNIAGNYSMVTKPGRTAPDEIRWSLDHGFYQQVLTLIESRMPDYFHEKGWLDFSESAIRIASEKTDDRIRQYREVFNAVIPTLIPKKDRLNPQVNPRLKPLIQSKDPRYNPLSKGILESSIPNRRVIRTVTHTYSGYTVQVDQPLKAIICLHIAFKELRNLCNHTDTENFPDISMKLLVQQVNNYLNWILKLKGQPEIRVN